MIIVIILTVVLLLIVYNILRRDVEYFKERRNIYIFASHKFSKKTREELEKVRLEKDDIVVLSNSPNDESIYKLLNVKHKGRRVDYRIIRGPQMKGSIKGIFSEKKYRIQNFENYNHEGCKYYMLESDCKNFEKLERRYNLRKGDIINETEGVEEGNKIKSVTNIDVVDYSGYDKNYRREYYRKNCSHCLYYPSAGYVACKIMRNLHQDMNIILVGFTFKAEFVHNMKYEKDHITKMGNIRII